MAKRKKKYTTLFVPKIGRILAFCSTTLLQSDADPETIAKELGDPLEALPNGIINAWTRNDSYIEILEKFRIPELSLNQALEDLQESLLSKKKLRSGERNSDLEVSNCEYLDISVQEFEKELKQEIIDLNRNF